MSAAEQAAFTPRIDTSPQEWKCESMPPAKRKDRIYVRGLDADGRIVLDRCFACRPWFKGLHPVVMHNAFRRERGIVRILMKRYDKYGQLLHDILHDYCPASGEYVHGQCLHPNNTYTTF